MLVAELWSQLYAESGAKSDTVGDLLVSAEQLSDLVSEALLGG